MDLRLPSRPDAARLARHWVMELLPTKMSRHSVDVIELLVSETVTNAVKYGHAEHGISVALMVGSDWVTVEVTDSSLAVPRVLHPAPTATGGRGVQLVDRLSDSWGVRFDDRSKTV